MHSTGSAAALVTLMRGGTIESLHGGTLAVVDADGATRLAIGDIERPVFARSAVKLLQALPLVASDAADRFGLGDAELALACASHGGEEIHVATAAGMLARLELDDRVLECGSHWPLYDGAARSLAARGGSPCPLHNNCSGKHAGFALLGAQTSGHTGPALVPQLAGYVRPGHPVMREVTRALALATGADLDDPARIGIDGCSIPTFAIPLRRIALAFARVAAGIGLPPAEARAAARLRSAAARAPTLTAGTGRFDTRVLERFGERVYCKVGAEGVYTAALPERGLGIALKVDDGAARAAEAVLAAALEALLPLDDGDRVFLRGFSDAPLRNHAAIEVGRLAATPALRARLDEAAA